MRRFRRSLAVPLAFLLAASVLSACAAENEASDDIDSAVLLPQWLFPSGGDVSECPSVPDDAAKDTNGGVPKAVCVTVENSGDDRASYVVPVTVQSKDDDPVVLSQVTVTTPPIDPGATGAAAIAAPGAEKVIDEWPDGQKDAKEAEGYIPLGEVQLKVGDVIRIPA